MNCGSTFLLYDDNQSDRKPHLHIVISDADENDYVVLVSVTTERSKSDTMVRLVVGDHPFIEHASVITYAYSKKLTRYHLAGLLASGDARPKEQASSRLLQRAQAGMLESDREPEEVRECFLGWWNRHKRSSSV
jgi:hypothetical protein